MPDETQDNSRDCVEITENMGEWFVRVVRSGKAQLSTFEVEAYARSFAAGQRAGLHLADSTELPIGARHGETQRKTRSPVH